MALTVATGFVVDDAIVVLENTSRHIEAGMDRMKAALLGAREVGFTVLSISLSLVAVFIPLLFMGGPGRAAVPRVRGDAVGGGADLARHLADDDADDVRLAAASPAATSADRPPGRLARCGRARLRLGAARATRRASTGRSRARALVMLILLAVIGLNVYLFIAAPKGFFPQQDTGQLNGGLRADQSISSQAMGDKLRQVVDIIRRDPAVDTVVGFTGGARAGGGFMFVNLKPRVRAHRARPGGDRAAAPAARAA